MRYKKSLMPYNIHKGSNEMRYQTRNRIIYSALFIMRILCVYFINDVILLLTPLYPLRKALAEPNFRNMSSRTGI